jgi:hypothetical protein
MGTASAWTPERRARQAAAIRRWRPWDQSTGPTTDAGKARVARNAYKGGHRVLHRERMRLLGEMGRAGYKVAQIIGAARRGRVFYRGEPISPDFATSQVFLAALARCERARAAWRQHELDHLPDHEAAADAIMTRIDARLRAVEE